MSVNALDLEFTAAKSSQESVGFEWFEIADDPSGWDRLFEQRPQGMFNLSSVLDAHARGGSARKGIVFRGSDGRSIPMGALVGGRQRQRSLRMLTFPSLESTESPELLVSLSDWLLAQGIDDIQLWSFTGGVEGYRMPANCVSSQDRLEFEWDLQGSHEQRYRALRNSHKRKLKRLLNEPLELRRIGRYRAEKMTRLRLQWHRRRTVPASFLHIIRLYWYYRFLHRKLTQAGVANLYGLYGKHGELLSLAYMLEVDDVAFYMIGASSADGYGLNSSLRLFWDLAAFYSERKYRLLNLGGVPAAAMADSHEEHGVFRFKAGFGIESTIRTSLSIKK